MSDTSVTQKIVDFLFPQQVWGPVTDIIMSGLKIGYFVALFFLIIYGVYWVITTWIASYKATGYLQAFPVGIFCLFLFIIAIVLLIGWMFSPLSIYGYNIFSFSACDSSHPDKNAGLCYQNCDPGYHGVGPVCWADTFGVGIGDLPSFAPCGVGIQGIGPLCIGWDSHKYHTIFGDIGGLTISTRPLVCPSPQDFDSFDLFDTKHLDDYMTAWNKPDPTKESETDSDRNKLGQKTRADQAYVKDKHREMVDGLCYKTCREGEVHVPGMPYLCIKKKQGTNDPIPLSYGRGVGVIPHWIKLLDKEQAQYIY
uniref:Uncharacterized protein n=1 Tax=viral metagenome TaxID=1070528 RepID=A0A6C0M0T6_9ZZZZ